MKYYLIPERCPECEEMFDLLLKLDEFRWSSLLSATARGRHCNTRWVKKLGISEIEKIRR